MRAARVRTILIVASLFLILFFLAFRFGSTAFYRFAGLTGPVRSSVISAAAATPIEAYDHGSPHRLAILVTDPSSDWLGLARGLRAHGVPFTLTRDPGRALQHQVVLVYPLISGRLVSPSTFAALRAHVAAGGSLLAFDVESDGLNDIFGVSGAARSRALDDLIWIKPRGAPEETVNRVNRSGSESAMAVTGYATTTAEVQARFSNGSAGVACHRSAGMACVMGVDLGDLSGRALDGRAEPLARAYVNRFEPSLDVLYQWLSDFYVAGETKPWLISTVPAGREVSILLTHDIDFTRSVIRSEPYAQLLRKEGVFGTFFMQTKYVRDYNDDVFFTREDVARLKVLQGLGMEIGSHTVAHSAVFKAFPVGTGQEKYPSYRPFVTARRAARGGSVFGEVRVSKFLLETLLGGPIASFRAGHLSNPFKLPDVLAAEDYAYDSSITADTCLTHLPFQLTAERRDQALEPVYEFPVTIEDEETPSLDKRFDAADQLVQKISRRGGTVVVLIHPDVTAEKLEFERRLIERWRDRAWIGSMRSFGAWWRARDQLETDVYDTPDGSTLSVDARFPVGAVEIVFPKPFARASRFSKGAVLTVQAGESRQAL